MTTVIKMLRTTPNSTFIGDRTYNVADGAADAMIKNGDAVFVEKLPDPVPEKKAPAAPAKSAKTKATEKKAAEGAAKKAEKAAQKKSPAWLPNTHVSSKRPASKRKR